MNSPLVSVNWLKQQLDDPKIVILDATMAKAVVAPEHLTEYDFIPGARHFDIDVAFCDTGARFPHTFASEQQFSDQAQRLGINHDSLVVVYDARGIYSAPRAWWMLTAMGHQNVKVLDGGLPAWIADGNPVVATASQCETAGNFMAKLDGEKVYGASNVLAKINQADSKIIDVRGRPRFLGQMDEPRAGVRAGHIPSSVNLPFAQVLTASGFKSAEELAALFTPIVDEPQQQLIFSCGSGITACIGMLAAAEAGYNNLTLYDGSWTEWGSLSELPIEK